MTDKTEKTDSFKVSVKNGDQKYILDKATGNYKFKTVDYVYETQSLGEALREFLDYVNDSYNSDKVTLTLLSAKKKDKK